MIRLLAVELNRFRSRRAIVLLALASILVAAVLVGSTAWKTRPLSATDRSDAAAQAALEGQRSEIQQEVRACRADPTSFLGPSARPRSAPPPSSRVPRPTTPGTR